MLDTLPDASPKDMPAPRDWRAELATIRSKGSQAARPGSLAGLAAARAAHHSQFFTPAPVVDLVWALLAPALGLTTSTRRLQLLDSSCGTGALFVPADPARFALLGVDVDRGAVEALSDAAQAQGFACDFEVGSLADLRASNIDLALLNPPFSIALSSPNLQPLPCTSFGRFGPHTSAVSHAYAVEQALEAADNVLAILPSSYAATLAGAHGRERLRALLRLPRGAFASEGTQVDTTLAVYGAHPSDAPLLQERLDTDSVSALGQALAPHLAFDDDFKRGRIHLAGQEHHQTISLPVTGDRRVRLTRNRRHIVLRFACGFMQAKCLNAVLREPVPVGEKHRYPTPRKAYLPGVAPANYTGHGALDIETHLLQPDPMASFAALVDQLRGCGAEVDLDPAVSNYLARRIRRHAIESTPLRRFAFGAGGDGDAIEATARATHLERALDFRSPRVEKGQRLQFRRETAASGEITYRATLADDRTYAVGDRDLHARFVVGDAAPSWRCIHPGRIAAHPAAAARLMARARRVGIDRFLTWDYQLNDAIEIGLGRGAICGWVMGLGKSRLALALALLHGDAPAAIVVPAHLVDELAEEFSAAPIDHGLWQVLTSADQPLRRVNLIAISRLRAPVARGAGRRTMASLLRRRFGTVVVDEAHALKASGTDQTRAIWALSPRRRYALTGSLINYPRDALQVARWVAGDGTALNPFGVHHPYLEARHRQSFAFAQRGVDAFSDAFVSLEWVCHTFSEDLQTGGKREVPRLRSPERYRQWLAPFFCRRLTTEPEVARHMRTPTYELTTREVEWDPAHFSLYRAVATEFATWYREARRTAGESGRQINMITILARIGAVVAASNAPHRGIGKERGIGGLTSKQRAAIAQAIAWHGQGKKSIVFAEQPDALERIAGELREAGIDPVIFHGGIPIAARTRDLRRFRRGSSTVLLASVGAAQTGLNLPMASRVLFLSGSWSAIARAQCLGRVLRPQQTDHVEAVSLELRGSIDTYQSQMCRWKSDAAAVGLDDQESELEGLEFEHVDALLARFVDELEGKLAAAA